MSSAGALTQRVESRLSAETSIVPWPNLLAQDIEGSMRYRDPERLMKYLPF
jgi:hypothetical protein